MEPGGQTGRQQFNKTRADEQDHPIEKVGEQLRGMMPFLDPVTVLVTPGPAVTRATPGLPVMRA